ncbi:hypothetical protein [Parabacteroides johnsonii]|jgi:hypothetical protein|uniref:Uncharacterized protein n=1 Tax=Parabacteroides johnsonii CL02T12C29 TaxID=999419 RepID=K5YWQ9_9BACT|nr:hypothetical protein [Parabacteroides johnsonii]EKN07574.1 hypothetical protein HMPREF1077_02686 [Parabacteroides johnsonii CL02T12C29]MCS3050832.1 hypothetical protein [Parabacteroides johnsonii]
MNKDNEKQLLTTGVYEAPKCEVVEMMGEGALLYGENSGINPPEELSRRGSYDEDEDY